MNLVALALTAYRRLLAVAPDAGPQAVDGAETENARRPRGTARPVHYRRSELVSARLNTPVACGAWRSARRRLVEQAFEPGDESAAGRRQAVLADFARVRAVPQGEAVLQDLPASGALV